MGPAMQALHWQRASSAASATQEAKDRGLTDRPVEHPRLGAVETEVRRVSVEHAQLILINQHALCIASSQ
jgi:hypothetical protein